MAACEPRHTIRPLHGLRCLTTVSTAVWQTARPQCVWLCLHMKTCHYINYNAHAGQCELGLGQCKSLQPDIGIMVNAFGPLRLGCLHWGSKQKPGWEPVQEQNRGLYVARSASGDAVLIGKLNTKQNKLRANSEGAVIVTDQDIEILLLDTACPFPWMPYMAGEPLPSGAVVGGHLADGTTTYVVKVTHNGKANFGYYEPKSALAYYVYHGARMATSMDILVLL